MGNVGKYRFDTGLRAPYHSTMPISNPPLEQRVADLESKVAELLSGSDRRDWRRSIGMFAGDDLMKQIDEEGRKFREEDRRAAIGELDSGS